MFNLQFAEKRPRPADRADRAAPNSQQPKQIVGKTSRTPEHHGGYPKNVALDMCERLAFASILRYMWGQSKCERFAITVKPDFIMYVCNCNGLNCRTVKTAIESGARTPGQIFRHADCQAQCGRCIGEMRMKIIAFSESQEPSFEIECQKQRELVMAIAAE